MKISRERPFQVEGTASGAKSCFDEFRDSQGGQKAAQCEWRRAVGGEVGRPMETTAV